MSLIELISFDPPPELDFSNSTSEIAQSIIITGRQQAEVLEGLKELYATPEGRQVIEKAAETSLNGRIHLINNPGGITLSLGNGVFSNTVAFGDKDDTGQYLQPSTGQYADQTIQRTLYHEIYHLANRHSIQNWQFNLQQEAETIEATNHFMAKYYGEIHRSTNYRHVKLGGTEGHDFSKSYSGPAFN